MSAIHEAACREVRRGHIPIPVPKGEKAPRIAEWQKWEQTEVDVPTSFTNESNMGVLLGGPSNNLIDIDLDCPEAVALADTLLPPTDAIFGRPGKLRSHRLYRASPLPETRRFKDVEGTCLVELRSTGAQTIFPPSEHPTGEPIAWEKDGEPAQFDGEELLYAVAKVAAASVLARHWPEEGSRHDAAMALAGALARLQWSTAEIIAFVRGVVVAAGDAELDDRLRVVADTLEELRQNRPTTGWKRLGEILSAPAISKAREWLGGYSADSADSAPAWEPPIPLAEFAVPPFPTDVFPPWLRDYVEALAESTQTPRDLAAMLALAVLAAACQKNVQVVVTPDWKEPVNLYVAVAMRSGERKSAVYREVTQPLVAFEITEAKRLGPVIAEAASARRITAEALKAAERDGKESDERGAEARERAGNLAREMETLTIPVAPRMIVNDCTPEALGQLLAEQGGRMSVMAPEGGVFQLMAGRYSANGAPNLEVYLQGHSGEDLRIDRIGRPPAHVRQPALTVGLAVQPSVIQELGAQSAFRGRGLLARFLYAIPESLVGRRVTTPPPVLLAVKRTYERQVDQLLRKDWRLPTDDQGENEPHTLTASDEAADAVDEFRDALEPRLGPGGDLEYIADWASKLPGAIVRIAGLLHIAEHVVYDDALGTPIAGETMKAAIRIGGDYLLPHAQAAFALIGADPVVADAQHILDVLAARDLHVFSARDLFNIVRGRIDRMNRFRPVLELLEEYGYIQKRLTDEPRTPDEPKKRGRASSPMYEVNPLWCRRKDGRRAADGERNGMARTPTAGHAQNKHNPQNPAVPAEVRHSAQSAHSAALGEADAVRGDPPVRPLQQPTTIQPTEVTEAA